MCLIPGHLVMPFEQTTIPSPNGSITTIGEHGDLIYVTADGGTDIRAYDDGFGPNLHTLPNAASDVLHYTLGGTEYIAWATNSGYTYYDGSTFVDDTTDTEFLTYWDDRLWGISNTGQLWHSSKASTETNEAQLQLPVNWVQALFTGPDATGTEIIYATARDGLYAHDAANARFVKTHVRWPRHDSAGIQAKSWNGNIYIPVGLGVYEYNPREGTLRNIGLDSDSGLPANRMGVIKHFQTSHLWLLAGTDDATSSHVWGWNQIGWGSVARSLNSGASDFNFIYTSDVSAGLGAGYRLWFAVTTNLTHVTIPAYNTSPNEDTALRWYDGFTNPRVLTPWFDAGQNDVSKGALRIHIEVVGADTNQTVAVGYLLNYDVSSYTALGTINSAGTTTYQFPNSSTPSGTEFRSIQIHLMLNTNDNTLTPNVKSVTLEYRKKLSIQYGFEFDVDLTRAYKDSETVQQMRNNIITAVESATKVELTYREDTGGTRNYYVDLVDARSLEETGLDETGTMRVTAAEV